MGSGNSKQTKANKVLDKGEYKVLFIGNSSVGKTRWVKYSTGGYENFYRFLVSFKPMCIIDFQGKACTYQ